MPQARDISIMTKADLREFAIMARSVDVDSFGAIYLENAHDDVALAQAILTAQKIRQN